MVTVIAHQADNPDRNSGGKHRQPPGPEIEGKGKTDARLVAGQPLADECRRARGLHEERLGTGHFLAHDRVHIAGHDDTDANTFFFEPAAQSFTVGFDGRFGGAIAGGDGQPIGEWLKKYPLFYLVGGTGFEPVTPAV